MCFCPFCGAELPEFKWSHSIKYLPRVAEVSCKGCGRSIWLEDRASMDQEGMIEVIFH